MGFLRRLFGAKKSGPPSDGSGSKSNKKRWSFIKHTKTKSLPPPPTHSDPSFDANKHAIAVAAATAAVAEAALAAAHAAAEVVRLTNAGSSTRSRATESVARVDRTRLLVESAAVKIQSAFRGYLARRALRALKSLVKLQALARGHIVRKKTADMLRRMQTLVRLQAQARASRAHSSDNTGSFKSSLSHYPAPEEYEHPLRAYDTKLDQSSILKRCSSNANFRNMNSDRTRFGSNWLDHWMEDNKRGQAGDASSKNRHPDDEQSDKILEVDTWKPRFNSHHSSSSSFQTAQYYLGSDYNNDNLMAYESPSKRSSKTNQSREALPPLSSLKFQKGKEEAASRTADNSPQLAFSASSRSGARRGGPFTPTRSECSWGFFGGYSGHPNYMANTESYRAKIRSQSAPRQRVEFDRYSSTTRRTVPEGLCDVGPNSDWDSDSRSRVFPVSSRLNRIESTNLR